MWNPNREVEAALNKALLPAYSPEAQSVDTARSHTEADLAANDLAQLHESFQALFASIPHDWHRKNPLAHTQAELASH